MNDAGFPNGHKLDCLEGCIKTGVHDTCHMVPRLINNQPMTKAEYIKLHEECCKRMVTITQKKNSDYTGVGDDPFKNFRKRGAFGFLVRMDDKLARIESFIEKGKYEVSDESFEDTCLDLANYAILLLGFMKSEKRG